MKNINEQDWEALARKFQNAAPFPSICIDNFLNQDFAIKLAQSYPEFSTAQKIGREFRTVNEKSKVQITEPSKFPEQVALLHKSLASKGFLKAMQTLSGIKNLAFDHQFKGGGMHMTNRSGILDVHVDFNFSEALQLYRRINLLIYLNEEWQDEWGGEVELWDKNIEHCVERFSPIMNRCVIFATSDISYHGVTAVNAPISHPRKSFALYLYNEEANATGHGGIHSTVFKARPDEKFKKYVLMPTESSRKKVSETYRSGKKLLKNMLR